MRRVLILSILLLFIVPSFMFAQEKGIVPCDGPDCDFCHVVQLGQNILAWLIGIVAFVIAIVFVIGGLQMVMAGGDTGKISTARKMMTNSIIGFVILLGAWLIINTIMVYLVRDNFFIGEWNQIQCEGAQDVPMVPDAEDDYTEVPPGIAESTKVVSFGSLFPSDLSGGFAMNNHVVIPPEGLSIKMPDRYYNNLLGKQVADLTEGCGGRRQVTMSFSHQPGVFNPEYAIAYHVGGDYPGQRVVAQNVQSPLYFNIKMIVSGGIACSDIRFGAY